MRPGRIVRLAQIADLDTIMPVMDAAKGIMRSDGNMNQWSDGYPSSEAILADIHRKGGFVMEDCGKIVGYFASCLLRNRHILISKAGSGLMM